MKQLRTQQNGFTIIELMIATAVFTMVLLLCTFAILNIGRTYYKGVTATRTQETARSVMEEITDSIRFGGAEVRPLDEKDGIRGFCIGEVKFSYRLDTQLVEPPDEIKSKGKSEVNADSTAYAVMKKTTPCSGVPSLAEGTELLKLRMSLDDFRVEPMTGSDGVYRVVVRIIHGDRDLLESIKEAGEDTGFWQCKNERAGSEYCAVSELVTVVERRI